jgi:ABC-type sugar transport system ATPase subunit/ribose/xylose/arabinose/galactoside ABC-type transport system permease subunit
MSEAVLETATPVLECRSVTKTFPGVLALDQVDLSILPGEIHALVGQNGAGKSTLVKTLTGVYPPDSGELRASGEVISMRSPDDAAQHGIAIVHQDSPLVPQFDVTRNVFLGREITHSAGVLDLQGMRSRAAEALGRVGANFGPDALIQDLTIAERELVAIAAALVQEPRLLILDEPTASLGAEEVDRLFDVIRSLQASGVAIVYISHHLDEIYSLASRITVMRDGRRAGTFDVADVKRSELIQHMVGRDIGQLYPKEDLEIGDVVLDVRGLQSEGVRSVDLTVRRGEIVGLAGLVGSGRTETALTLFGAMPRTAGTVELDGSAIDPGSPFQAKRAGMALIPEDRRAEGLVTESSVRANLTLASQNRWARGGLVSGRREKSAAGGLVERLRIATPGIDQLVRNLSGGNQQKVVIGRWLPTGANLYIFDEPTTGVDVGAKVEIYREMSKIAAEGAGVLMISSDFEELVEMCDRIVVMKKGLATKELRRGECTVQDVLRYATGADEGVETAAEPASSDLVSVEVPPGGAAVPEALVPAMGKGITPVPPRASAALRRWGAFGGMALAIVLMGVKAPRFFGPENLLLVLKQGSIMSLLALALTVVLISGGLDMSVGAISQLTANLASGFLIGGSTVLTAFGVGLGTGLLFGAINTFFVVVIRLSPFVTTLGTMFIAIGWSFAYNKGQALTLRDQPVFFFFGQGHLGPLPVALLLVLVITAVLHLFLKRTRPGLRMYAVGEAPTTAILRGVSWRRAAVIAFLVHGVMAGFAGVLLASYSYGASALATGLDFLISAFAAAFLGSVLSKTGELDVVGTVIAAMFITSLSNGLILNGASNLMLPGIQGAILIASILVGVVRRRDVGQMTIF